MLIVVQEIRVNWAYQSSTSNKEDTSNHYHIFVGDLSNEVNDEVLSQAFSAFGSISEGRVMWDMKTGRSRGYGFVAYRERLDAEKAISAMNGEWLGSRAIRCNWANQKGQPSMSQQQTMQSMGMTPTTPYGHHQFPSQGAQSYEMVVQQTPQWQTTCYVGNLTPYTTQNDLVPLFSAFGYVVETRFQSDRGFAFIKMGSHEEAAMAICHLNGHDVNGRPLKCSVCLVPSSCLIAHANVIQWGKDRPPTGQFDAYSPHQPQTPSYAQSPSYGFPQYAGPQTMTPQGGPPSASPMSGYPPNQSPMTAPSPGGRGYGGYGQQAPAAMPHQGYGQMPPSAGGYRPDHMQGGYAPQSAGGYQQPPQSAGGYQPAQHAQYGSYQP